VLDISLVRSLHATFFEGTDAPRQSVNRISDRSFREFGSGLLRPMHERRSGGPSPVLAYKWARAEDALSQAVGLDPDPFDDTLLEYQNPLTGGPALPTIGTAIQKLRPGAKCKLHRHTGSVVYYVVRGEGITEIDGQRFAWSKGDFLALPPWAMHAHQNSSEKTDAILFQVNDIPVLKSLGLYREEAA